MGMLAFLRRVVLREHEREHAEVTRQLDRADTELASLDVRLRRLEIEKRLRGRQPGDRA